MLKQLKKHWPIFIIFIVFSIKLYLTISSSIHKTDGRYIYPLDDAYIHMSMAKNLVVNHVWGVTKHGFSSSTSSPLWTFIVSLSYYISGVNELSPLIINIAICLVLLAFSYKILLKYISNKLVILITLIIAMFATPLFALATIGMEHSLHLFLSLLSVELSVLVLVQSDKKLKVMDKYFYLLIITLPFLVMTRYEGLFFVLVVSVVLVFQKRIKEAFFIGLVACLPVLLYGILSINKGWSILPNPLRVKGFKYDFSSSDGIMNTFGFRAFEQIANTPHITVLLLAMFGLSLYYFYMGSESVKERSIFFRILIIIGLTVMHMQYAGIGWYFRYESYLIFCSIIYLFIGFNDICVRYNIQNNIGYKLLNCVIICGLCAVLFSPLYVRYKQYMISSRHASHNIYDQQYQMARFIKKYYNNNSIVLNDIGAVTFFSDITLLDYMGLGTFEILDIYRSHKNEISQQYSNLIKEKNFLVAVVYDHWAANKQLPVNHWIKIAEWKIQENAICASDTISFYAINKTDADDLLKNLRDFSDLLPKDVEQKFYKKEID